MVASPRVGLAGAAFPPKLICLKNQFEGLLFSSGWVVAAVPALVTDKSPARLGGDDLRLDAGELFGFTCIALR